jgi:hypothetical protein
VVVSPPWTEAIVVRGAMSQVHDLFNEKKKSKFPGKSKILTKTPPSSIEIAIKSLVFDGIGFQLPFYIQTPRLLPNYTNTLSFYT